MSKLNWLLIGLILGLVGCTEDSVRSQTEQNLACECSTGEKCSDSELQNCQNQKNDETNSNQNCSEECLGYCDDEGNCIETVVCPEDCPDECDDDGNCVTSAVCSDECSDECDDDGNCVTPAVCPEECPDSCDDEGNCLETVICPEECPDECDDEGKCPFVCPNTCMYGCGETANTLIFTEVRSPSNIISIPRDLISIIQTTPITHSHNQAIK